MALTPLSPSAEQLTAWGLDPSWSRRVTLPGSDGKPVDWHVLDTGPGSQGTIVCVHGNPTWGYLWRNLLETLAPEWRVIAVDQTGMGYSERGRPRVLADRVTELVAFCQQEVTGSLILAAQDWGGPVAVGAAGALEVEALILSNTAVAKPEDVRVPPLISIARRLVDFSCRRTPLFVNGTARMTHREHRHALRAPYRTAARREAVRDFVADIPVSPNDPSFEALARSVQVLEKKQLPTLLIWGGKDPVFHDRFLRDLKTRIPQAEVQRYATAGHLALLDEPVGNLIQRWLTERSNGPAASSAPPSAAGFRSVLEVLGTHSDDTAAIYSGPEGTLTWSKLELRSDRAASVLHAAGLVRGTRVALLIPPSPDLLVAVMAIWKNGGVPVLADASGGLRQLRQLIRAAAPNFVVGTKATCTVAWVARFAPGAHRAGFFSAPGVRDLRGVAQDCPEIVLAPEDVAAIVHTSGATGPAKAVRYTHGALAAQRVAAESLLAMTPGDAFTTSFGAFMVLAPSLEMTCIRPDFNINKPSTLGFDELRAAIEHAQVTAAWLSPASARCIVATARGRQLPLKLVMLAGAPVATSLMESMRAITGGEVCTPYGMTECLPVTDGLRQAGAGRHGGVDVGTALEGSTIVIRPLTRAHGWGEILIKAPWMLDGYEQGAGADLTSWVTLGGERFHRTGDVGYLEEGRLFCLGRLSHVIDADGGLIASVEVEEPVAGALGREVAAVGTGPQGTQVLIVVVDAEAPLRLAPDLIRNHVRAISPHRIAAVLEGRLPKDHRHESKVDRTTLSHQVATFLAGR